MNANIFDNSGYFMRERENGLRSIPRQAMQVRGVQVRKFQSVPEMPPELSPDLPSDMPLAMAYVPFQQWGGTLSLPDALKNGTLFRELVFPFEVHNK